MWKMELTFTSKNLFEISKLQPIVMDKFQRRVGRDISLTILSILWVKFVHKFLLEAQNLELILEMKFGLISQHSFGSKFFEKSYSTIPKWGLKLYFEDV